MTVLEHGGYPEGGAGVALVEVGLEEVDARGHAVGGGVVARGEEVDQRLEVAGGAEIAGDGGERPAEIAVGGGDLFVELERRREVLPVEVSTGLREQGGHVEPALGQRLDGDALLPGQWTAAGRRGLPGPGRRG